MNQFTQADLDFFTLALYSEGKLKQYLDKIVQMQARLDNSSYDEALPVVLSLTDRLPDLDTDFRQDSKGKKCGNGNIPAEATCHKGSGFGKEVAKAAAATAVGGIIGAGALGVGAAMGAKAGVDQGSKTLGKKIEEAVPKIIKGTNKATFVAGAVTGAAIAGGAAVALSKRKKKQKAQQNDSAEYLAGHLEAGLKLRRKRG